jgi:hypothetical protein
MWVRKILGGLGQSGLPDLLGCWKGRAFAIEVKRPDSRYGVTARQSQSLAAIRRAGGIALVARSLDDVIEGFEAAGCPLPFQRRMTWGRKSATEPG